MKLKRITAIFSALAMSLAILHSFPAQTFENDFDANAASGTTQSSVTAKINYNTVNINVINDEAQRVGIIMMKNDTSYASWTYGNESMGYTEYFRNITPGSTGSQLTSLPTKNFPLGEEWLYGRPAEFVKSFTVTNDRSGYFRTWNEFPEQIDSAYLSLTDTHTVTEEIYKEISGVDYTLAAGQYALYVDSNYTATTDYANHVEINDSTNLFFNDYIGKLTTFSDLSVGEHKMEKYIRVDKRSRDFGSIGQLTIPNKAVEYVKVTQNITELTEGDFADDGSFVGNVQYDFNVHYSDLSHGTAIQLIIVSGSIINVVTPDANGNMTFYLSKDDYKAHSSYIYYYESGAVYGSSGGKTYSVRAGEYDTYTTTIDCTYFTVPDEGITFYAVDAGTYTLTLNNDEYYLENNTITVSDTTDIQTFNVTLKKKAAETTTTTTSVSASLAVKPNSAINNFYADDTSNIEDVSNSEFELSVFIFDQSSNKTPITTCTADLTDSVTVDYSSANASHDISATGSGSDDLSPFDLYWSMTPSANEFTCSYKFNMSKIDELFSDINTKYGLDLDYESNSDLLEGILYDENGNAIDLGSFTCKVAQRGDANLDHAVDTRDAASMAKYCSLVANGAENPELSANDNELAQFAGDVNGDGVIDTRDAASAAKYASIYATYDTSDAAKAYYAIMTEMGVL